MAVLLISLAAAAARSGGSGDPRCSESACLACLRRCWDRSSDSRRIVRDLSSELTAAGAAGGIGACASADEAVGFVRAVRAIVRAHRSAIGVGRVWGLGLHGSSGHFWLAFYACVRSSVNRGQCHRASLAPDHGFFLLDCPGRRVCKLDTAQVDSKQLPHLAAACLRARTRVRRKLAPDGAARAHTAPRSPRAAANASARAGAAADGLAVPLSLIHI